MIFGAPHRQIARRSPAFHKIVSSLSSEQWSFIGFGCLTLTALAGYLSQPYLYAGLLFIHDICDINDGYVYQKNENGTLNGYGLYIDHMLDGIGASFVTLGGYLLLEAAPLACAAGLVFYYLIAIHSWLYKINKIGEGQPSGVYYAVTVSRGRMLWLNVDDLTVVMAVIVLSRNLLLLYLTDAVLLAILVTKVFRATLELRATRWLPVMNRM